MKLAAIQIKYVAWTTALKSNTLGIVKELAHTYNLDEKAIQLNKRQAFPDIVAGEAYGVEVKQTKEDRWSSTGSSIVESTRSKGIDRIYLLFGKMGGNPEFKCRPYEECMEDIAVTHSPRYRINMELEPGQTIFDKMKISYEELRKKEDIIEPVRVYYKKRAQEKSKKEMPWVDRITNRRHSHQYQSSPMVCGLLQRGK